MVTPLSRSSFRLSMTQANSKVAFPLDAASFLYSSMTCGSTAPVSNINLPTVVDFPWSTCPMNARLRCGFASAIIYLLQLALSIFSVFLPLRLIFSKGRASDDLQVIGWLGHLRFQALPGSDLLDGIKQQVGGQGLKAGELRGPEGS